MRKQGKAIGESMMFWKHIETTSLRQMAEKCIDGSSTSSSIEKYNNTNSQPPIPGRDADFGTAAIIKTLYEGKNSGNGHFDWVDSPPKQLNKKVAKAHNRVAIKVYKIKDSAQETISGRTPLKVHMVQLQSQVLVSALQDIFKGVNEFLEVTETATFKEPFKPLFFCYDKIVALYEKTEPDGTLKQHLRLLVQVMAELFGGFMAHLRHLRASGLISYKLAWTYFPKDTFVFCGSEDCTRVCRVVDTDYEGGTQCHGPRLAIHCEQIAFDGVSFVWKPISVYIPSFGGNLPITALPNYPLSFHPDQDDVKARLIQRGKRVISYQDLTYCEYSGIGMFVVGGKAQKHNVSQKSYHSRWQRCKRFR
jgi:hypothetical protein